MKKILTAVAAAAFACAGVAVHAADNNSPITNTTTNATVSGNATGTVSTPPALTTSEAKDLKVHSKAEYKARKKVADANLTLNKADCETAADGSVERACKKEAKASAKKDKAHAKGIYATEKAEIKELSK